MSKGSNRRPTDHEKFSESYDRIFSGKASRGSYVQDPKTGKLVPKEEFVDESESHVYVLGDIQPYKSIHNGEIISSRSQHREHLKRHGLYEIGNDIDAHMKQKKREPSRKDREKLRQTIGEIMWAKGL